MATVAPVAAAATVASHVPRRAIVEAMEGGERELPYPDGMVAEHGVVRCDDGGDKCRVAREPH